MTNDRRDDALLELLRTLDGLGFDFVPPTPATHARVFARSETGTGLRDLLGWSRVVPPDTLDAPIRKLLEDARVVEALPNGWRSSIRVARLRGRLFLHSAYPTEAGDAVFFGPDSYRFAEFIVAELARDSLCRNVVDVGTGSGVGLIVAASLAQPARLAMTDINPAALRLARINARHAGLEVEALHGCSLAGFDAPIDLALANPPFIIDAGDRAYRHGGGMLGAQVAVDMARTIAERLNHNGRLLLYTGSAIVDGRDGLQAELAKVIAEADCTMRYLQLDPDVFGEELDLPAYRDAEVERIAIVGAVITRR